MSKEVEQLRADLDLVTKTAKVLATKLEKISTKVEKILNALEGTPPPKDAVSQISQVDQVSPRSDSSTEPKVSIRSITPSVPSMSQRVGTDSKATRLLDSFLAQVNTMSKGKEISKALSRLRDQVMQSAEVGFHPAFHEMGRYSDQIKKIGTISEAEKEELFEKIYDWKARLSP